MNQPPEDTAPKPVRRPRLHLPFDGSRSDAGTWAYDHRVGLCVTLILYLVLMIVFVSSRIVVGRKPSTQGMYIDLQTLAELEAERNRLQEQVKQRTDNDLDWRSVRNRASNENALNENLRDDRGSNAAGINSAAAEAQERMRANREAYEQGLAEEEAIRRRPQEEQAAGERQDARIKGTVTVSFSFVDPVRTSRHIEIPAYLCEGGGEVVVEATVDRGGRVIGTRVRSGGDDCMREAALRAAELSIFNIDNAAPARQQGTITYVFIPQ